MQIEGQSTIEELTVLGNWAHLRTHLSITVTVPDRDPVRRSGYTLTIMRKEADGKWRLARDANLLVKEA
jgi:uncharacterized protein (TIGR02246 family)